MIKTKRLRNTRGVAIFVVFATVIVVIIFANVVLTMMLSHARLTQHQVGRIQAYYAGLAGMNYAFDRIRAEDSNWLPNPDTPPNTVTRFIRRTGSTPPDLNEGDFSISSDPVVEINIGAPGSGINGTRQVRITVTYLTREAPTTP